LHNLKFPLYVVPYFEREFFLYNNIISKTIMATKVKLETNHGDIIIELYDDMPITTENFINLIKNKTYNNVIFHRIIDEFMIQGGDPTGTGMGDPKIPNIKDEFTHKGGNKNNRGTISMANAGPNTGSSQFFINLVNNNFLDGKHPTFGVVVEGMNVVDKISEVETNWQDKPQEDVKILEASIL
jgi:peptidylprolyl isomerase